jgi:protein ImuB
MASLPIAALRLDPAEADLARSLGIETAGTLLALPRSPLARRFGNSTLARLDKARGIRADPIDPVVPAECPQAGRRFAEPILTAASILHCLEGLADELAADLLQKGMGARTIALTLTRIDATDQRITIGLARPNRDSGHILRLLSSKVETVEPGFGIEAMALVAEHSEPLVPQHVYSPLSAQEQAADIALLIDKLAMRLGCRRLYRCSAVESDVPERSHQRVDPLHDADSHGWELWRRPVRLLDPPEPVRDVMSLLPDGFPRRFTWRGKTHFVARGDGPERIYGEWWRRSAERDAARDYFQVEDQFGARFWLFRRWEGDTQSGDMSWHMHGLFG